MDSTNKSSNVTIQVFNNGLNESIIDLSLTDDSGMVTEMINSYHDYNQACTVADMLSESTDDLYSVAESEGFIYVNESSSDKKFKGLTSDKCDESITVNLSSSKKYDDNQYANNDSIAETLTTKHIKYSVSPELDSDGLVRLRFINAINDYDMLCKSFSNCRVDQDNDDVLLYMI